MGLRVRKETPPEGQFLASRSPSGSLIFHLVMPKGDLFLNKLFYPYFMPMKDTYNLWEKTDMDCLPEKKMPYGFSVQKRLRPACMFKLSMIFTAIKKRDYTPAVGT